MAISLTAAGYLTAAAAFAVLVALTGGPWRRHPGSLWVAGAATIATLWAIYLALHASNAESVPLAGGALEGLRNAAWSALLLALLATSCGRATATVSRQLRPIAVGLALFWVAALLLLGLPDPQARGPWPAVAALTMVVVGLVLIEQLYRNTPPQRRWEIKFLCLGLGAAFAFDLFLFADLVLSQAADSAIWQARGFVNALIVPLIAVSVARRPAQPERHTLSRHLLFHGAALSGTGLYLLAVAVAAYFLRHIGGELATLVQVLFLFGAVVLLGVIVTSGSLRARLRVLLAKHFLHSSFDYRQEWLQFTGTLSDEDGELPFRLRAIHAIGELVESPGGLLWVFQRDGRYTLDGVLNLGDPEHPPLAQSAPLIEFLNHSGWVIDLNEYRRQPAHYPDLELPAWLTEQPRYWAVVPLFNHAFLSGWIVLAQPRAPRKIDWEERDLLKTAGRQLAVYIALGQTDEALVEARQFEAFHRLAAFLVHDLKNISAQLSLVCANAERHADNPDFVRDAVRTVANARDRLERTQLQLRQAQPSASKAAPRAIELAATLRAVVTVCAERRPHPELSISENAHVVGDPEALKNILMHLVRNAQEATDAHGAVRLHLSTAGEWAVIRVEDTGAGIAPDFLRHRLFRPFQTTKGNAGMGIGLYEAHEQISNMGGRIDVESTLGVGATFTVWLPLQGANTPAPRLTAQPIHST